jgi:hypothetical protein
VWDSNPRGRVNALAVFKGADHRLPAFARIHAHLVFAGRRRDGVSPHPCGSLRIPARLFSKCSTSRACEGVVRSRQGLPHFVNPWSNEPFLSTAAVPVIICCRCPCVGPQMGGVAALTAPECVAVYPYDLALCVKRGVLRRVWVAEHEGAGGQLARALAHDVAVRSFPMRAAGSCRGGPGWVRAALCQ